MIGALHAAGAGPDTPPMSDAAPSMASHLHQSEAAALHLVDLFGLADVERHRPKLDQDLVNLSTESERDLVVAVVDRGAGVAADVECFIPLQEERNALLHALLGDFFAVYTKDAGTTLAEPAAVVGEIEDQGVLTGREVLAALPTNALEVEEVPERPACSSRDRSRNRPCGHLE